MFSYLQGKIVEIGENYAVIDVNGVGYEVLCSQNTVCKLQKESEQKVFTYLSANENGITLFGFATKKEKALFNKLISVSGVGPKSAITILSGDSLENIVYYIALGDSQSLSRIKGLGKKTAEKIIVELRDKLKAEDTPTINQEITLNKEDSDAIMGLLSLGFSKKEAEEGVKNAKQEGAKSLEEIISKAIKKML